MNNDATALINSEGTAAYPMDAGLAQQAEACPACQTQIPGGEQFCPRCGFQRGTWAADGPAASGSSAGAVPEGDAGQPRRSGADPDKSVYFLENGHGQQFGLAYGETVIGRGEVDIQINDNFASRRHARFTVTEDGVMVEDLGSSNGTFIEEAQLAIGMPLPLSHGEKLKIGGTVLTLRHNDAFGAAPQADIQLSTPTSSVDEAHLAETTAAPEKSQSVDQAASGEEAEEGQVENAAPAELSPWGLQFADGEPVRLKLGSTTFGRKTDRADLLIEDGYVSSLHGQFEADAEELILTDLGSTNGTLVNEEKLTAHMPRALAAGDIITLGQTQIVVSWEE